MPNIEKCPDCNAKLEATVKIHLNDVVVDDDGRIISYELAFGSLEDEVTGGESVDIYCANDHVFSQSSI